MTPNSMALFVIPFFCLAIAAALLSSVSAHAGLDVLPTSTDCALEGLISDCMIYEPIQGGQSDGGTIGRAIIRPVTD